METLLITTNTNGVYLWVLDNPQIGTWWTGMAWFKPTGKYCSIRHMEYSKFHSGIFGRMESAPSSICGWTLIALSFLHSSLSFISFGVINLSQSTSTRLNVLSNLALESPPPPSPPPPPPRNFHSKGCLSDPPTPWDSLKFSNLVRYPRKECFHQKCFYTCL